MGNLAMQCCAGMSVVRVLRPNGRIEEYRGQILVSELMERYPQHLVIHANYLERDVSFNQHRRKVTILPPQYRLLPGHDYILYPIPLQFREAVAQTFAKQQLEATGKSPFLQKRKMNRKARVLASTRQHLTTILHSSRANKVGDRTSFKDDYCEGGVREPLMAGRQDTELEDFSFTGSPSWKPSLYSIPEGSMSACSEVSSNDGSHHWHAS